jgi:hypothetical protein
MKKIPQPFENPINTIPPPTFIRITYTFNQLFNENLRNRIENFIQENLDHAQILLIQYEEEEENQNNAFLKREAIDDMRSM